MSASEKLKALEPCLTAATDRIDHAFPIVSSGADDLMIDGLQALGEIERFLDALPQIVAVVEAAELHPPYIYVGIPMEDGRPSVRVRYPLVEALSALEETLA